MRCNGQKPRFVNKNSNANERNMFKQWWNEAIDLYGVQISYFTNLYNLTGHDFIYGEHPTAGFSAPVQMLMLAQMNSDSLLLSKFGIMADADLTLVITIDKFAESMGVLTAEPKAGDLIRMDELGYDRPGGGGYPNSYPYTQMTGESGANVCELDNPDAYSSLENGFISGGGYNPMTDWLRGPNVFEITERRDENIPGQINPLMGHIVWYIKCKRFDYSYEPNAPREHGSNQVSDETLYGKLSGGTPTEEPPKKYPQNVDQEAQKNWDYSANGGRDRTYGDY